MNAHLGSVVQCVRETDEVRVRLGSVSCRVCGGRNCALKDRVVRAKVTPDVLVAEGDTVRITGDPRALVRALVRLIIAPLGAAVAAVVFFPGASREIALLSGGTVLGVSILRGSRRQDLPRVLEVVWRAHADKPARDAEANGRSGLGA